MQRTVLGAAGVIGAIGVGAAAWVQHHFVVGADAEHLDFALTAVRFALVHAAVLVGVAALLRDGTGRTVRICFGAAATSFVGGFVFFCGGLWLLAAGSSPAWAQAVPIGGTLFIVGWLAILAAALAPPPAG
ncbi:MAG TPA: DUF423 domain-containing protein [Stellaceae bacterium]|nr:DUF423 domain-containing protein [Stellaceae bacterium]